MKVRYSTLEVFLYNMTTYDICASNSNILFFIHPKIANKSFVNLRAHLIAYFPFLRTFNIRKFPFHIMVATSKHSRGLFRSISHDSIFYFTITAFNLFCRCRARLFYSAGSPIFFPPLQSKDSRNFHNN